VLEQPPNLKPQPRTELCSEPLPLDQASLFADRQVDSARKVLRPNRTSSVKFDEIIPTRSTRSIIYKQAVAGLIAQQETKVAKVKILSRRRASSSASSRCPGQGQANSSPR